MSFEAEAQSIVEYIGGTSNIVSLTHCATRLRFVVHDKSKVNGQNIEKLNEVLKFLESGGQEQVVIGPKVESMYDAVMTLLDKDKGKGIVDENYSEEDLKDKKSLSFNNLINSVFSVLQATFTPILPAMAGVGLIKALSITLSGIGVFSAKAPTLMIFNGIYNAFFYFLPIIISISMARKFKVDIYVAAAIGASILEPTMIMKLIGVKGTSFLGIPFSMENYSSTVFPVLIAIPIYTLIYKFMKKRISSNYHTLLIPFISLLIMVPFIILIIGPIAVGLGDMISGLIMSLFSVAPILAGLLLGGLWEILVTFGLHWAIMPIVISNIATKGADSILACAGAATWAAIGIAIALIFKAKKDPELRSVMAAAIIPVLFAGITEPIVYGALLRYRKCMAYVIVAGAIGGAITAVVKGQITLMFFSILSLQTSINWIPMTIGGIVTAIIGFVLVMLFGYKGSNKNGIKD